MSVDLSVIIPTFRRPVELIEAIGSALAQQIHLEVIVIDDNPEGSAADAVAGIGDSRVRYMKSIRPSGGKPALVRNQGWKLAQGRFVHFLDDDDLAAEGAYKVMIDALDASPGKGVVFGRIEPFGKDPDELQIQQAHFANGAKRAKRSSRPGASWLMMANLLFKDALLANSACIIRRECIELLGGYDPECVIGEDLDFWLRAIRRFDCVYLDRLVMHYRTGAPSLMHAPDVSELLIQSYQDLHNKYRAEHGFIEFISLKVLARTVLKRS